MNIIKIILSVLLLTSFILTSCGSGTKIIALKNTIMNGEFFNAGNKIGYCIYQYLIGSFTFGVILGLSIGFISLILLNIFRKK